METILRHEDISISETNIQDENLMIPPPILYLSNKSCIEIRKIFKFVYHEFLFFKDELEEGRV